MSGLTADRHMGGSLALTCSAHYRHAWSARWTDPREVNS